MKITIVGAGRVGSRSIPELASRLSEGDEIRIVDRDVIEETTLEACPLYGKTEIGRLKAEAAAEAIAAANTNAKITVFAGHLGTHNVSAELAGVQMVLDCTDNWQTRILLNEYCWGNGIPWVYSAALRAHSMVSSIVPGETPCFACWAAPAKAVSCSEVGVEAGACEKAAEKQVEQAAAIIAGGRPALAGKLFYFNSRTGSGLEKELKKNPSCSFCCGGRSLLEDENGIQLCGDGEWQFLNSGEEIGTENIFRRLDGVRRARMGAIVKTYFDEGSATVFANSRVVVRAGEKKKAVEINQLILQKIN